MNYIKWETITNPLPQAGFSLKKMMKMMDADEDGHLRPEL
jgi:hypothetical protein